MSGRYSIADAKNQLPRLVHEAERGGIVQLTRRGRPVAVLVSQLSWERLTSGPSFWEAMSAFRARLGIATLDIDPASLTGARDHGPGREVVL